MKPRRAAIKRFAYLVPPVVAFTSEAGRTGVHPPFSAQPVLATRCRMIEVVLPADSRHVSMRRRAEAMFQAYG
jgi:hypothetical protein